MAIIIGVVAIFLVFMVWSCCRVAAKADYTAELMEYGRKQKEEEK